MKKFTNAPLKIAITLYIALYTVILYFLPFGCVFLEVTGIPCLGCGMTRAWLSVLKLDFSSAFSYHFMFWSIPILYWCLWIDGNLFKNKKLNVSFYVMILIGFLINWVFHIFS